MMRTTPATNRPRLHGAAVLFDSFGMHPRTVRFFILEKGVELPRREIDLFSGEHRQPEYLKINPSAQLPALRLSDGTILCEAAAICEYLEEVYAEPALIGSTAEERALTRMWWRRADLSICQPMIQRYYFAEGLEFARVWTRCLPDAADGIRERARDGMRWLDEILRDQPWICGSRFTVADIYLYCCIDEFQGAGQPMPDDCISLSRWHQQVSDRPAAQASLWKVQHPALRG